MSSKVKYGELDEFSLYPWNPRETKKEKYQELKKHIETRGITEPLKVRETPLGKEIWDGEHRYRIAKELGHKRVPYINYGEMTDEEVDIERIGSAMEGGDVNQEKIYEKYYKEYDKEESSFVEIAKKYGVAPATVRHGIIAWKEREETGEDFDKETREQLSFDSWKDISRLPDDMKEDAVKKRANGEITSRELKRTVSSVVEEERKKKKEEKGGVKSTTDIQKEESSPTEEIDTEEVQEEDETEKKSSLPIEVDLYLKGDLHEYVEGLTDENRSLGEVIIEMIKYCQENEVNI